MAHDKKGRMQKWCEAYKQRNQRGVNKVKKQERAKKREERFEKRREEGKAYEYKPNPYNKDSENKIERRKYWKEKRKRSRKNVDHRLPLQKMTSIMRKVQNELDKQKAELKLIQKEIAVESDSN